MKLKIAPSILSADKTKLQEEVDEIEDSADLIHVDVMDGKFVPPSTFRAREIANIKSNLPKDVHLMVDHPLKDCFIENYINAGAKSITIHEECKDDINECLDYIKSRGIKAAISINPPTELKKIEPYLKKLDMVLVMSVNPGYSGQKFIPEVLEKVKKIRNNYPDLEIQIDGGIDIKTIKSAREAGANIFVAGSAIYGKEDRVQAIIDLRNAAE